MKLKQRVKVGVALLLAVRNSVNWLRKRGGSVSKYIPGPSG